MAALFPCPTPADSHPRQEEWCPDLPFPCLQPVLRRSQAGQCGWGGVNLWLLFECSLNGQDTRTAYIIWDCPRQTGIYGHSIYDLDHFWLSLAKGVLKLVNIEDNLHLLITSWWLLVMHLAGLYQKVFKQHKQMYIILSLILPTDLKIYILGNLLSLPHILQGCWRWILNAFYSSKMINTSNLDIFPNRYSGLWQTGVSGLSAMERTFSALND